MELRAKQANLLVGTLNLHFRFGAITEAESSLEYLRRERDGTSLADILHGIYRFVETRVQILKAINSTRTI